MEFEIKENAETRKINTIRKQRLLAAGLVDNYLGSYQHEGERAEEHMKRLCSMNRAVVGYLITGMRYAGVKDEGICECLQGLAFAYHVLDDADAEKIANGFLENWGERL